LLKLRVAFKSNHFQKVTETICKAAWWQNSPN
jgi:hypothetical protein